MDDEALRKSFGDAGKEMIRRYDIRNQASELLDWIVLPEDYAVMKACAVLEGERPDREQMKQLKEYQVCMIVPKTETGVWKEMGFCAQGYEDRTHLLKILSEFV